MNTTQHNRIVQPHLSFEGRCEEAIEFYRKAAGAELLMLARFKDMPGPPQPGMCQPGSENKVMHARLRIGQLTLLVSDGRCMGKASFQGFALSISVQSEAEVDPLFTALGEGGQVMMPLAKTFFSARFGMVTDKFGVPWMMLVHPTDPAP
jgi:PhnB protein